MPNVLQWLFVFFHSPSILLLSCRLQLCHPYSIPLHTINFIIPLYNKRTCYSRQTTHLTNLLHNSLTPRTPLITHGTKSPVKPHTFSHPLHLSSISLYVACVRERGYARESRMSPAQVMLASRGELTLGWWSR